jgi:hypothetical protein
MKRIYKSSALAWLLLLIFFSGSVFAVHQLVTVRGKDATLEEVLYLPSGKVLKRLSLGYSALLADVYWTRAVQYFGSRHRQHSIRYDLLYPLLDITTDLDPKLIPAYENGAVFLSQRPPDGAGQPDNAVILAERGTRANPEYWRLYFTLGFVHYIDRHDPKAAQLAFEKGSQVPGARPWMNVMAARMAEHGKDITTSIALWEAVHETTTDKDVKQASEMHLNSLHAERDITELEKVVQSYRQHFGVPPANWADLVRARLLPGVPVDPMGKPYQLGHDGTVNVFDPGNYRYLGEWRSNMEQPF